MTKMSKIHKIKPSDSLRIKLFKRYHIRKQWFLNNALSLNNYSNHTKKNLNSLFSDVFLNNISHIIMINKYDEHHRLYQFFVSTYLKRLKYYDPTGTDPFLLIADGINLSI